MIFLPYAQECPETPADVGWPELYQFQQAFQAAYYQASQPALAAFCAFVAGGSHVHVADTQFVVRAELLAHREQIPRCISAVPPGVVAGVTVMAGNAPPQGLPFCIAGLATTADLCAALATYGSRPLFYIVPPEVRTQLDDALRVVL